NANQPASVEEQRTAIRTVITSPRPLARRRFASGVGPLSRCPCPTCQQPIELPEKVPGLKGSWPHCDQAILIPGPPLKAPPAPASAWLPDVLWTEKAVPTPPAGGGRSAAATHNTKGDRSLGRAAPYVARGLSQN